MRKIYRFKGPPGAGKSTEAETIRSQNPNRVKRVNMDSLRRMLDGGESTLAAQKFVSKIRFNTIESALRAGYDVIDDNTNFSERDWHSLCEVAQTVGDVQIIERLFLIPKKECVARNRVRENPIPEHIIHTMYDKHVYKGSASLSERTAYFPPIQAHTPNPDLPTCIIVDLDGTLAINDGHREFYDYSKVLNDSPNAPIVDIVRRYEADPSVKVIYLTGREAVCDLDTWDWLKLHDIVAPAQVPTRIFTRRDGDNRRDDIIKEEIYRERIEPNFNVLFILDDRDSVVRMWRRIGLTCLQVNWGDF